VGSRILPLKVLWENILKKLCKAQFLKPTLYSLPPTL
jgi:hypothetical protein